jgi:hypothetical protein
VIQADDNTVYLMTEEWVELARNLTREDFQALVLDNMRRQSERLGIAELATSKAVTELKRIDGNLVAAHRKMTEMAEEIRRLKTWAGIPEKNDPPTKGGPN